MNQTYRILPVYTSDVSGVCSALFELGGLVVMHDPSGCNSTYNTHDEIRWYDYDSLIFISALTEQDAVNGNDKKLVNDILEAAEEFRPEFIAVTNSPIPYINGTDFSALMRIIEKKTGIPSFYVPANGMHDYTAGAGRALERVALRLVDGHFSRPVPKTVNILGATPLDYAAKGNISSIRAVLENAGYKVNSVWAMDDSLDNIRRAGEASVNLIISSCGLLPARILRGRFGTPYTAGTPAGKFTEILIRELDRSEKTGECITAYNSVPQANADVSVALIGDPVVMGSLAAAIRISRGIKTRVFCPTETTGNLLGKNDIRVHGEEETEVALRDTAAVIADPLYRLICPDNARFYPLPTLALSGRIYLKQAKILSQLEV